MRLSENLILLAVYVDMLIYRSIHTAFNEFISVSILGKVNHCRFTCSEQEYMVVCYSSYCHGLLIGNQFLCYLIYCIYLSCQISVCRRLFQKFSRIISVYYTITFFVERVCAVLILLIFNCLIPDLIRILNQFIRCIIGPFQLFGQFYCAGLYRSQVETHLQVGCARASLHVEHLHLMCGVIIKNMNRFPVHCFGHKEIINSRNI